MFPVIVSELQAAGTFRAPPPPPPPYQPVTGILQKTM